ncbi:unnamed protein product [Ambrosiozyma monospora]|uniref:Unnamed protein product n=1 Tax=Ambrosiozyma monospora TaxID=43982 RepID=A0ACB5T600_AMBMO|nr:unnamed protein product [Ambrosiozyma monospora]
MKLPFVSCGVHTDKVLECLASSFYQNAAKFKKYGEYQNLRNGLIMKLHPTSSLYGMGDLPKYVIYHDVMLTGEKQFMNYVSYVNGEWLAEFGGIFYTKKEKSMTAKENQSLKEIDFKKLLELEMAKKPPVNSKEDKPKSEQNSHHKTPFARRRFMRRI